LLISAHAAVCELAGSASPLDAYLVKISTISKQTKPSIDMSIFT
jgi:hypothetical protein